MLRLLKLIFFLIVILAGVLIGYAYFGDLTPDQEDASEPFEIDAN